MHLPRLRLPQPETYAERPDEEDRKLDRWWRHGAGAVMARGGRWRARRLRSILRHVSRHDADLAGLGDAALTARLGDVRVGLRRALQARRPKAAAIAPAFALIREMADRTLGLRHYDVQVLGAWALMQGHVAEMRTGEGKTLCATLAAATMALGGVPVHVITVNDYLARRDADEMEPLYRRLGLTVGLIQEGQSEDDRRAAYRADIVYGANKEIAFDYLRDRMELRRRPGNLRRKLDRLSASATPTPELRMRGLHFALVDEADSVLIDEARTPLVISGAQGGDGMEAMPFARALDVARRLTAGTDYRLKPNDRRVELTERGRDRIDEDALDDDGAFAVEVIREHLVTQALAALHLFHEGDAYILRDGKVQIVDENTGRTQEDRSWSEGLHQMIELKEGVEMTAPRATMARITYQRVFRRYRRLAGMTGTARDAAWELYSVYGLTVARIPTHRPDRRRTLRDRVFRRAEAKWRAVVARVAEMQGQGRAVLVGTRSVSASEEISRRLRTAGIAHEVLNAAQDADEAGIVARAGEAGRVIVATNMAGRGTDIKLADDVRARGGLHVILTDRHDSRRVDQQLAGRCGRQGDPGTVEAITSLEDELIGATGARWHRRLALAALLAGPRAAGLIVRARQRQVERMHARMRYDLLASDRHVGQLLALSGPQE